MSEVGFLFRSYPFVASVLLLCLSPAFVLICVLFSPLIVTLLLFFLGIAGLARWRRKLGRQRSRRRRKNRSTSWKNSGGLLIDSSSELECEKQNRVQEYLEDQLKNLEELNWDSSTVFDPWDFQFSDSPRPASCPPNLNCGTRSDVSEIGENSEAEMLADGEAWSDS